MPDLESFKHGFNLIKNKNYAGYFLKDIQGVHEAVIKYKEYRYHLTLIYTIGVNPQMSEEEFFNNHIFEDKIIVTHYGNPYMCKLWKTKNKQLS